MIHPLLLVAAKTAENSSYKQRLGAVLVKQGKIISRGFNHFRTHKFSYLYNYPHVCHAETHAILRGERRIGIRGLNGCTLFVARINSRGEMRLAKPCEVCEELCKQVGIKTIVWSSWDWSER